MDLVSIFIAFAGGIFGAAIGALQAFVILGFLILVGVAAQATGADLMSIPLGTAFGPHVGGFAAGVAAAAYASRKGKIESGRDIVSALMGTNSPDVLLIGGIFSVGAYILNWAFNLVPFAWTDTVALSVVVSAIVARLLWGNGVFGQVKAGQARYAPGPDTQWLPWQSTVAQRLMIGLGAGVLSAHIALLIGAENGGVVMGFAISAISLSLLGLGVQVPVTHHITLVAAVAATASGSLIWGAVFGMGAGIVGEYMANTFLVHGDTHIDPPACTIVVLTSLSILLQAVGVYGAFSETIAIVILVVLVLYGAFAMMRQSSVGVVEQASA
ncbi:permease [Candidatus Leptofilum sp.]|uniref:permease n=1 Tax=Candidatus Leptofilum sp. TaxID=3241576 RepID=UPI003B5B9292